MTVIRRMSFSHMVACRRLAVSWILKVLSVMHDTCSPCYEVLVLLVKLVMVAQLIHALKIAPINITTPMVLASSTFAEIAARAPEAFAQHFSMSTMAVGQARAIVSGFPLADMHGPLWSSTNDAILLARCWLSRRRSFLCMSLDRHALACKKP